jgi:NTE family protein
LGLALGGGGALGGVHVGVLKVLENEGVPIGAVAGASAGAIIGALYALTLDARQTERRILDYLESENFSDSLFDCVAPLSSSQATGLLDRFSSFMRKELLLTLTVSQPALIPKNRFRENLARLFQDDITLEDTLIPFAAIATDLEKGDEVVLREGSLIDALYASSTYPGLIEAARLKGRLLVDGGITSIIPVEAARSLGGEVIVGVNAQPHVEMEMPDDLTAMDVIYRAEDILTHELAYCKGRQADLLIHPGKGGAEWSTWYDLRKLPSYIPAGEEATRRKVDDIRKLLENG